MISDTLLVVCGGGLLAYLLDFAIHGFKLGGY